MTNVSNATAQMFGTEVWKTKMKQEKKKKNKVVLKLILWYYICCVFLQ